MKKILITGGIILVLGLLIFFPGKKWARGHVDYKTGVGDHPLNCISCHLHLVSGGPVKKIINKDYFSPNNLAVTPDGTKLYIVAQDGDAVIVADAGSGSVEKMIPVGKKPYTIILNKAGSLAFVSNQWDDNVMIIDIERNAVTDTIKCGNGPSGLALGSDEKYLYAVNTYSSNISILDLESKEEISRLESGSNPTGISLSPSGDELLVTARRANINVYGEPLVTDLTRVNENKRRVESYLPVESAYLMENVAFTPDGDLAFLTMIRPKNLIPTIQIERGWMMTNGIAIVERKEGGRIIQLLIDEPNTYYADPYDIVITPDGKKAFVSSSGVNIITAISIDSVRKLINTSSPELLSLLPNHLGFSGRFVEKRISVGANPKGLTISPDGKFLYVAERLDDRISVISTESLEIVKTIDLGGPRKITVARRGRRLLNNAGHTFQAQYSCYTCHPDEHEDGLMYNMASKDMGRNVTNTQSLREIGHTAPFKWNGKNQTVFKQDGIRFSTVLTRTEQFSFKDLDAIATYIMYGINNPPNLVYNPEGILTDAQLRGKVIFERTKDNYGKEIPVINRCITCHPAPFYTNKQHFDVSTLAATDDSILFDTPHLNNIFASPPYLHDGRAKTLEEIWTLYGKDDKHGLTSDMTKIDLNDLVEYLKSLRSPDYNEKSLPIQKAQMNH